jgi:hypothetical protein
MALEFKDAVRERIPLLVALYGPTGSGKTFGALLLAAGLAGQDGTVGLIDAENKRGSLYADDPDIRAAMPHGRYKRLDIAAPYTPKKYIAAVKAAEDAGFAVCVIDSTSHEWAGEGGCCDIAENNKLGGMPNWALAKIEHKRFMAHCLSSQMHIIFCFRAHEKTKPVKKGDPIFPGSAERHEKTSVITLGMLPDTEKNALFEVLVSLRIEDETHFATPVKVPKMLSRFFPGGRMLTKADGEAIRKWNESGVAIDPKERLRTRARSEAEKGTEAYAAFYGSLKPIAQKFLDTTDCREVAGRADQEYAAALPTFDTWDSWDQAGAPIYPEILVAGERHKWNEDGGNYVKSGPNPSAQPAQPENTAPLAAASGQDAPKAPAGGNQPAAETTQPTGLNAAERAQRELEELRQRNHAASTEKPAPQPVAQQSATEPQNGGEIPTYNRDTLPVEGLKTGQECYFEGKLLRAIMQPGDPVPGWKAVGKAPAPGDPPRGGKKQRNIGSLGFE